ncbi:MAG: hypothetical protein JXA19_06710 [Anaerolineales bacterium]|nr:hypothetical protein [Anaerolineales bacterium]
MFLTIIISFFYRNSRVFHIRKREVFRRLRSAIALSVENGTRLHFSLGSKGLIHHRGMTFIAGLNIFNTAIGLTFAGDKPPITTSGDGSINILVEDMVRNNHQANINSEVENTAKVEIAGVTPFSFIAGEYSTCNKEDVSVNLFVGSFDTEIGLLESEFQSQDTYTFGGSDSLTGQAILFSCARNTFIGEELFAGSALLGNNRFHIASLHAQDIVRVLIILMIIGSSILNIFGFGQ